MALRRSRQLVYAPSLELLQPLLMLPSGGRFSNLFDDVPEQWRVYADFLAVQEAPLILLLHASYLFSTIGFPWQSY
ncbi:uncharacterized protein LOC111478340 isoform X3 [Cucurbita maxima]|uniref:Uncharacterized protein LOC111478340 isoform X3 n=1 Tax=Cucurbita maxima TaxID=3661 RepID=A0A6J1ITS0_CUCMA|nr:uncharacterized protein LOC111478340 isoform X3 [Cucurbita maxima]